MDTSSRMARIAATVAFMATTLVFWQTFRVYSPIAQTTLRAPSPAGEIVKGFEIHQTIVSTAADGTSGLDGDTCFGLRFATYQRKNSGTFAVTWTQNSHQEKWTVAAPQLADNVVKYFCPKLNLESRSPFTVSIAGVDGKPGSAATVWLTRDVSLGRIDGFQDGRALALRLATQKFVGAHSIAVACHHAFLASWLATVLIGLLALGAGRKGDTPEDRLARQ